MHCKTRQASLLIIGVTYLAYFNAYSGPFQFDDYNVIVNNPVVHSFHNWLEDLGHGIRPVLKLSYVLNWLTGGVVGFHLFNVGIHAANAVMVYCLSSKFIARNTLGMHASSYNTAALLTALLFTLHPVQTEAVTYISGRSVSLMAFFYLSSLLLYINGSEKHDKWSLYIFSPLLFAIAVATKEVAVTLPAALLLWEICGSRTGCKNLLHKQWLHWALLLILLIAIALHPKYGRLLVYGFGERGLQENLFSQINALMYLISRLFWLHRLNIDPDLPVISNWNALIVLQFSLLLGLLSLAIANIKNRPWIGFGILWFFLHLLPTNSIIPRLDIVNERQLYLASIGIFLALAIEFQHACLSSERQSKPVYLAVSLVLCVLAGFTLMRNHSYRNEIALWEDTTRKSPHKARAFNNLGVAYELGGFVDKARNAYYRAAQLNPAYDVAAGNLERLLHHSQASENQNRQ